MESLNLFLVSPTEKHLKAKMMVRWLAGFLTDTQESRQLHYSSSTKALRHKRLRTSTLKHVCPIPSLRESLLTTCDCTFALLVVIRGSVEVSFLKIIRHFAI
jgi:hypothetical protein